MLPERQNQIIKRGCSQFQKSSFSVVVHRHLPFQRRLCLGRSRRVDWGQESRGRRRGKRRVVHRQGDGIRRLRHGCHKRRGRNVRKWRGVHSGSTAIQNKIPWDSSRATIDSGFPSPIGHLLRDVNRVSRCDGKLPLEHGSVGASGFHKDYQKKKTCVVCVRVWQTQEEE